MASQLYRLYQYDLIGSRDLVNQSNDPNIGSSRNGSDDTTTQDALDSMGVNTTSTSVGTWPILFPIHATGGGGAKQLDQLNFSNVKDPTKYYAHVLVSWVFFGFIFYMVVRESVFYAGLRQAYFISPMVSTRLSSRTVLFMSVPKTYMSKAKLRRVFGDSVRRIWIATETEKLDDLVKRRDSLAYELEFFETKLVKKANKERLKYWKKHPIETGMADLESGRNRDFPFATPWAAKIIRPTCRRSFFSSEKVDRIEQLRAELEELIPQVEKLQAKHKHGKAMHIPAVFIEFATQGDAQLAYQTLSHHQPFTMSPRYIGVTPDQVIWGALKYSWLNRLVRKFAIQGAIAALIIFWSIPSAIVGTIANINYLTNLLPFLKWMNDLPNVILSIISGVLPAAGLAVLMSFVPILLRFLSRQTGVPSIARAELFMQNANFCFQLVQVFLVTTLTSAASAAVSQIISDPLSLKDLLARNLPKASNFYISYFLLQGLVLSTGAMVQLMGFLVYKLMRTFFDSTPRKIYERWSSLSRLSWGTVFPTFTNMAVIAITYSCIAPLILGFASFGLFLVYHAYRYNLLFVYDCDIDTKGLVYPRALQQLLTGIYLAEVCLLGLFAIKGAIGPLVMMILSLIATALGHIALNEALRPLLEGLPKSLDEEEVEEAEEEDLNDDMSIASGDGNIFQRAIRVAVKISPKTSRNLRTKTPEVSSSSSTVDSYGPPAPLSVGTGSSTTVNNCSSYDKKRTPIPPPSTCPLQQVQSPPRLVRTQTHRLDVTPKEFFTEPRKSFSRFFKWFCRPDIYANPLFLSKKVRRDNPDPYDATLINHAYFPPSVRSPNPLLWIPHDVGGVSSHEVRETTKNGIIHMTDDECHLNDKNKVIWDKIGMRPPIFTEKIFY
ncbi:hypothetical protein KEM56_006959 [Ascosphaera pollenicola]|nr:hypothetical protein KEM56_006959 [Ascosphaera pollenicola]